MNNFKQFVKRNKNGEWVIVPRTYEEETPPPYQKTSTLTEHEEQNKEYLGLFEKMLRAGTSGPDPDGSNNDLIPFFLASPRYLHQAASLGVSLSSGKGFGHIIEGEVGFTAKPEHVRFYGISIFNPALLDSVPSTLVTPIPTLLLTTNTVQSAKSRKGLKESLFMLAKGSGGSVPDITGDLL